MVLLTNPRSRSIENKSVIPRQLQLTRFVVLRNLVSTRLKSARCVALCSRFIEQEDISRPGELQDSMLNQKGGVGGGGATDGRLVDCAGGGGVRSIPINESADCVFDLVPTAMAR